MKVDHFGPGAGKLAIDCFTSFIQYIKALYEIATDKLPEILREA
jgi:hypothetical protein